MLRRYGGLSLRVFRRQPEAKDHRSADSSSGAEEFPAIHVAGFGFGFHHLSRLASQRGRTVNCLPDAVVGPAPAHVGHLRIDIGV